MKCEITYINENKNWPQGAVETDSFSFCSDSIDFITERKWLIYFFQNEDIRDRCKAFIDDCIAADTSFRLYVERPPSWSSEWEVRSWEMI